jgi:hypothetical protein
VSLYVMIYSLECFLVTSILVAGLLINYLLIYFLQNTQVLQSYVECWDTMGIDWVEDFILSEGNILRLVRAWGFDDCLLEGRWGILSLLYYPTFINEAALLVPVILVLAFKSLPRFSPTCIPLIVPILGLLECPIVDDY